MEWAVAPASAAAAAMAFDGLFDLKIKKTKLVEYAAEGEIASAGTRHYDNVSGISSWWVYNRENYSGT